MSTILALYGSPRRKGNTAVLTREAVRGARETGAEVEEIILRRPQLAFTACGRYDGFWEIGLSAWDVAAGALLVREAGGIVTDVVGGDSFLRTGDIVAEGDGIHTAMLGLTRSAFA